MPLDEPSSASRRKPVERHVKGRQCGTGNNSARATGPFDERTYLDENPDVAAALAEGHLPSALFHYRLFGPGAALPDPGALPRASEVLASNVEAVLTTRSGAIFIIGWADDRAAPLDRITIEFASGRRVEWSATALARFRRADAEAALGIKQAVHLGFCGLLFQQEHSEPSVIRLYGKRGAVAEATVAAARMDDLALRDVALGYLASLEFAGNRQVELSLIMEPVLGDALVEHNRMITDSIIAGVTAERFDPAPRRFKGSIVVCLYGRPEYQFLQNVLFSAAAGARDYEFIYVCNSPELIETLCRNAAISQRIYDLNVTLVLLPGNAGFGAANNVAARYARSDRLLIVNPDVLPIDKGWAARHNELVDGLPADQTRLFGARLFYCDGSLMHAGMYVERDQGVSVAGFGIRRCPMLRVEHYGKGAPGNAPEFKGSRPVTAVSGAFISLDRAWFERLGGFAEDYIFGHYEDADLCLRSLGHGVTTWVHDLDFWHLEGKGSTRLPHHEGASAVNRWLFTREWHDRLVPDLIGRVTPSAAALKQGAA